MSEIITDSNSNQRQTPWEQKTLEKVLLETIKENRRKRRWNLFFRLIYLLIFLYFMFLLFSGKNSPGALVLKPHTALIKIEGNIDSNSDASAENITKSMHDAFKNPNVSAIVLQINSSGGSPVQASQIFNEIWELRQKHKAIKVYAVCTDLCASAAYYIASAAENIYADKSSLVGSIGVLINGFGFVETLNKLGVERRLLTAGSEKGFLDPFSPLRPEQIPQAQRIIDLVHQQFIESVKLGRGNRLVSDPNIFSGLIWTGIQAKELGLIDGFGSSSSVARSIKVPTLVDYTQGGSVLRQFGQSLGSSFSHSLSSQLDKWSLR